MFKDREAFSTFSVNDLPGAKRFYGELLGLDVAEVMDGLALHLAGGGEVFLLPKDDRTRDAHRAQLPAGSICR